MTDKQKCINIKSSYSPQYHLTFKSKRSKISKMSQQEIRRINFLGEDDCTCRVVIPRAFAKHLGIVKGTYLKMYLDKETDKITVERLDSQEPQIDR